MKEKTAQLLLKKVKDDYSIISEEFDQTRSYVDKEFELFDRYFSPRAKIIDLGCGNGRIIEYLNDVYQKSSNPDFSYIGVDNSNDLLDKAKKKYGRLENIRFISGDQLDIPLKESDFDIAFNIRAFHHIPSKKLRLKVLDEIKRVLKNDGILILTVWNLMQKKYFKYLIRSTIKYFTSIGEFAPNDTLIPWNNKAKRYYHAFLPFEIKSLFKKSGFKILEFKKGRDLIIIAQNQK